jgi:hypothetical protein
MRKDDVTMETRGRMPHERTTDASRQLAIRTALTDRLSRCGLLSIAATGGCRVDDVTELTATTTGADATSSTSTNANSTSTTEADSTSAVSSGSGADSSGTTAGSACGAIIQTAECAVFPTPTETFVPDSTTLVLTDPSSVCPCAAELHPGEPLEAIIIEHPSGWPTDPATAPVVVFHHGNGGQAAERYDFSDLAARGFVVVNVETEAGQFNHEDFGLACGLEFARGSFEDAAGVDCNLIIAGHSAGGRAAADYVATPDDPSLEPFLRPYALRGAVLIAPASGDEGVVTLPEGGAVPILILVSASDEDTALSPVTRYDRSPLESTWSADETQRAMVYSWGTDHASFGGALSAHPLEGAAIVAGYVPAFAAATVYADSTSRQTWWSYLTRSAYPDAILDASLWSGIDPLFDQSPVDCGVVSVVDCDTTPGCETVASDCVPTDCSALTAVDCLAHPNCAVSTADECMHLPRLRTSYTAGLDSERVQLELFEADPEYTVTGSLDAVDGAASTVVGSFGLEFETPTGHDTGLLGVQWGGAQGDGEVVLPLPHTPDLQAYTHLSLRVGGVVDTPFGDNTSCTAPTAPVSFEIASRESLPGLDSSYFSTGAIVQNDAQILPGPVSNDDGCRAQQTMNTLRVPMERLLEGLGPTADHLVLRFSPRADLSRVLIDTIELTNNPLDPPPVFGTLQAGWECEVDELAIIETSCNAEPTPTCPTVNVVNTAQIAPLVEIPGESAFRGWYVHTPKGAILDPADPTDAELDAIRSRCASACELEYAHRPEIAATCDAADAFFDPVLVTTTDAHASNYAIPDAFVNGYWGITDESLALDLRTDACEAFDEDLCPARMARVTEAREQVGRGEEWRYSTLGVIVIDSEAMAEPVMGDLTGTLGGTLCDAGTATEACAAYLGSATLELVDPLTISLSCDGQTVVHTLDELSLSLAQPAFGLKSHDETDWSAFPPGALVFDAHTVVDTIPIDTFLPNQDGVTMKFNAGWAQVPLYSHFEVSIDLPCNGEIVPVSAWFGLADDEVLDSPPSGVAITVPNTLTCPQTRALTGTASDTDNDIASVRWIVDDVLLAPGTTSMAFTRDHDLTAIVRDARGATRTVHKHVDCI